MDNLERSYGRDPVAPIPHPVLNRPTLPPVPTPLTSFVGREGLTAAVEEVLHRGGFRLLTLTGPGGVGKTRLALHVAARAAGDYPGGVGFFPLADVRDPARLLPAIALSLGIREGDRHTLLERVAAQLGGSRVLLVLDNLEQVVTAAPALVGLLGMCPGTTLLVTSRTPLHVSGERVIPIPPLSVSDRGDEAGDAEAVQLFLTRAGAVQPDITATEETTQAVAEICRRLDGLPLAIELAAARTSLLPIPVMLERLTRRLQLLANGPRDQPLRLQTMYSAIAWSYDLLAPAEQALYRQLSAFAGGFSFAAAVAVAAMPEEEVMTALESLIDHSLVRAVVEPVSEPRFTMLETIQEFGLDQLAGAGEEDAVRERHASYFLERCETIAAKVESPDAEAWLARLDLDRPNIQAALTWLARNRQAEGAVRLGASMWNYWRIRGYLSEGRQQLTRALDLPGDVPGLQRADALWKLGYLEFYLGGDVAAREHLEQAIALFEEGGDWHGVVNAGNTLGNVLRIQRDLQAARVCHERALAVYFEANPGEREMPVESLAGLGMVALDQGAYDDARSLLEKALEAALRDRGPREIANRYLNLARVELATGHLVAARELVEQGLAILGEIGDQVQTTSALEILGQIALRSGDTARGIALLVDGLTLRLTSDNLHNLTEYIEKLAVATVAVDATLATRLMAVAARDREATGMPRLEADAAAREQALARAQETLGERHFADIWQSAQGVTVLRASQEAIAALASTPDPDTSVATAPAPAEPPPGGDTYGLTTREVEVLRLVAAGHTNRAIAADLFISPATAKRHVTNILAKLGLPTRAAAISFALRNRLTPEERAAGE